MKRGGDGYLALFLPLPPQPSHNTKSISESHPPDLALCPAPATERQLSIILSYIQQRLTSIHRRREQVSSALGSGCALERRRSLRVFFYNCRPSSILRHRRSGAGFGVEVCIERTEVFSCRVRATEASFNFKHKP
jgi:hypothetical protein